MIKIKKEDFNVLIAKRDKIMDEDWKTFIAQKKPYINKGDRVKFKGFLNNFYGKFMEVYFNDMLYYVNESDFEGNYYTVKRVELPCFDPLKRYGYIATDRYGIKYRFEETETEYVLLSRDEC